MTTVVSNQVASQIKHQQEMKDKTYKKNPGTRFRTNQLRLQSLLKPPTLLSQGLEAMSPKKTTRQEIDEPLKIDPTRIAEKPPAKSEPLNKRNRTLFKDK